MIYVSPWPDTERVERCCFCRFETRFWYHPMRIACCKGCATLAEPEDVPDRHAWRRREEIATDASSPMLCGRTKKRTSTSRQKGDAMADRNKADQMVLHLQLKDGYTEAKRRLEQMINYGLVSEEDTVQLCRHGHCLTASTIKHMVAATKK